MTLQTDEHYEIRNEMIDTVKSLRMKIICYDKIINFLDRQEKNEL